MFLCACVCFVANTWFGIWFYTQLYYMENKTFCNNNTYNSIIINNNLLLNSVHHHHQCSRKKFGFGPNRSRLEWMSILLGSQYGCVFLIYLCVMWCPSKDHHILFDWIFIFVLFTVIFFFIFSKTHTNIFFYIKFFNVSFFQFSLQSWFFVRILHPLCSLQWKTRFSFSFNKKKQLEY